MRIQIEYDDDKNPNLIICHLIYTDGKKESYSTDWQNFRSLKATPFDQTGITQKDKDGLRAMFDQARKEIQQMRFKKGLDQ